MLSVAAVVVTYNRKTLLARCLERLVTQSQPLAKIIIVDNASTDGTQKMLGELGFLNKPQIELVLLASNSGGAGGFHAGLSHALQGNYEWFWLMDDDALPEADALAAITAVSPEKSNIYASTAVFANSEQQELLCWPSVFAHTDANDKQIVIRKHSDLNDTQEVKGVPFLGFLVSRELIEKIGLPDKEFFISGDDIDYGERAKKANAKIILVKRSKLHHPAPQDYRVNFLGQEFFCLRLVPWRRYYDVRNRVLIGKRYFGSHLWTQTLPGLIVRMLASLWYEPRRLRQIRAYTKGMLDGLLGRVGKRVEPGDL